ncbi:MAG: 5-bromo-4-chloroindolyl phosphate hydrolysis family protein [Lachnospiraceae bacterium]
MKKEKKETLLNIITALVAGGIFLILLFGLKWNIVVALLLSIGIYVGLGLLVKRENSFFGMSISDIKEEMEIERRLDEARKDYMLLKESAVRIEDEGLRSEAVKLNRTAERIIAYLENHPERMHLSGRFIDYYQDTASSLLKRYVEIQDTRLETEEVRELKKNTMDALKSLNLAFDRQFEKLMSNEMYDMDAEMRLLEHTTKMEN